MSVLTDFHREMLDDLIANDTYDELQKGLCLHEMIFAQGTELDFRIECIEYVLTLTGHLMPYKATPKIKLSQGLITPASFNDTQNELSTFLIDTLTTKNQNCFSPQNLAAYIYRYLEKKDVLTQKICFAQLFASPISPYNICMSDCTIDVEPIHDSKALEIFPQLLFFVKHIGISLREVDGVTLADCEGLLGALLQHPSSAIQSRLLHATLTLLMNQYKQMILRIATDVRDSQIYAASPPVTPTKPN